MIKCISFRCGHVESSQAGEVIFSNDEGFETPGEALRNLALGLYQKYTTDFYDARRKACCKKAQSKDKKARFCSTCSRDLKTSEFDSDKYQDWLRNFGSQTADSLGSEEISDGRDGIWTPWNSVRKLRSLQESEIFEISHCAESILVDAIAPHLPEDSDLSEIGYLPEEYTRLYQTIENSNKENEDDD